MATHTNTTLEKENHWTNFKKKKKDFSCFSNEVNKLNEQWNLRQVSLDSLKVSRIQTQLFASPKSTMLQWFQEKFFVFFFNRNFNRLFQFLKYN